MIIEKRRDQYVAKVKTAQGERWISLHTDDYQKARRLARAAQIEKLEAARISSEALQIFTNGKQVALTVVLREWRNQMRVRGLAPLTINHRLIHVKAFMRDSRVKGHDAPGSITDRHVAKWVNENNCKASTRRKRLELLRMFFIFCRTKEYIRINPAEVVYKINTRNLPFELLELKRKIPFTDEEIARLVAHIDSELVKADADLLRIDELFRNRSYHGQRLGGRIMMLKFWRIAIAISRWAGLRISDVSNLEWKSLEKPGVIIVHTRKTGKRIELPLCEPLAAAIADIPKTTDRFCFAWQHNIIINITKRGFLGTQFVDLCKAAGITGKSFHCLRSTFCVDVLDRLMAVGKTREEALKIAASLVGHSHFSTTERHYIPSTASD